MINLVLDKLTEYFPKGKTYGLHEPLFNGNEWKYIKECLDTGWVSSVGKFVDRFEHDLAAYTGAQYALVTVNGTAALHMGLLMCDVQAGDEVLVPTLTFVATCNAICYTGAFPHFIDSDSVSLGVNPVKLADYLRDITVVKNNICYNRLTGRPIRALCVMHTFGHPADLDKLEEICEQYKIALLEDAAEALGSYYKGEHVGHRGRLGILSFNGNKILTTGGGGAILTNNKGIASRAKHLTTTAKLSHPWQYRHDAIGYNYRMPNINAALGCAQLEQITFFVEKKRNLANTYSKLFSSLEGVKFFMEPSYAKSNYWLNVLLLDEENTMQSRNLVELLHENNIGARPVWELMHHLPMFKDCAKMDLSEAEKLSKRLVNIPSSVILGCQPLKQTSHCTG